jgi:hypothetical protein
MNLSATMDEFIKDGKLDILVGIPPCGLDPAQRICYIMEEVQRLLEHRESKDPNNALMLEGWRELLKNPKASMWGYRKKDSKSVLCCDITEESLDD